MSLERSCVGKAIKNGSHEGATLADGRERLLSRRREARPSSRHWTRSHIARQGWARQMGA
jgi:hypothetical protein